MIGIYIGLGILVLSAMVQGIIMYNLIKRPQIEVREDEDKVILLKDNYELVTYTKVKKNEKV